MPEPMAGLMLVGVLGTVWGVVLWIGGAFLAAWVASEKNRDAVGWWALSFVLSPLLALVALAALPAAQR